MSNSTELINKWLDRMSYINKHGVSKYNQTYKPVLQNFSQVEAENYCKKQIAAIELYDEEQKKGK